MNFFHLPSPYLDSETVSHLPRIASPLQSGIFVLSALDKHMFYIAIMAAERDRIKRNCGIFQCLGCCLRKSLASRS
jgi:hypothetical protein